MRNLPNISSQGYEWRENEHLARGAKHITVLTWFASEYFFLFCCEWIWQVPWRWSRTGRGTVSCTGLQSHQSLYQSLHISLYDVALIHETTSRATLLPRLGESTWKHAFISQWIIKAASYRLRGCVWWVQCGAAGGHIDFNRDWHLKAFLPVWQRKCPLCLAGPAALREAFRVKWAVISW